jgi:hypothetical protein
MGVGQAVEVEEGVRMEKGSDAYLSRASSPPTVFPCVPDVASIHSLLFSSSLPALDINSLSPPPPPALVASLCLGMATAPSGSATTLT